MKSLVKFSSLFFIFLFLYGCEYTPIFSKKDVNFSIDKITFYGDKQLKKNLIQSLSSYRNLSDKEKKISLILENSKNKIVTSKNSKGEDQVYKINVNTNLKININDEDNFFENNITKSVTYSAVTSKSEERQIEDKLVEDMSVQIGREIVLIIMEKTR